MSFASRITGAQVLGVRTGKSLRWPLGIAPQGLVGRRVQAVRRRGKYLLMDLDQGLLLWHLGMSGSLCFGSAPGPAGAHDHFDLITSHGVLRLNDPRRFGAVIHVPDEDSPRARKLLATLGMEPLSAAFTPEYLRAGLRARRGAIKQVLLSGKLVVGVGNIYANEALFAAGIRPSVPAHRIGAVRAARLHAAIVDVLQRAVALGGSTLRDFSNAKGESGYFQLEAMVYGRAAQPCKVCGQDIRLSRQGQRSSFWCPHCQKS